jgi:hypothetical protein
MCKLEILLQPDLCLNQSFEAVKTKVPQLVARMWSGAPMSRNQETRLAESYSESDSLCSRRTLRLTAITLMP